MQKILQFFILLSISVLYINGDDSDYCYAKDNTPYKYFADWTSYDDVKGATVLEQGCSPVYVWGLIKHGVRSLSSQQIERNKNLEQLKKDIEQNNKDRRSALCSEDNQNINSWNNPLNEKQNDDLAKKAFSNHEIFATYLGNFIDSTQKPTKDNFDISNAKGANDSAIKFTNKLLGTTFENTGGNSITQNDVLLRSKDNCAKWTPSYKERDDFDSTPIFNAMAYRISYRLGYSSLLTFDNILAMYESCIIGNTLTTANRPPFCAAFLPEDLKIIEYRHDLKHYYESGYGNSLGDKFGCPLVRDMVDKLSKVSTGTLNGKKGAFYFADDENLMGVLVKLGLYRDQEALKHDNYQYQKGNRQWKTSTLSPYTATIHAVVFNCANNEKKVEFYHNQNIIKLEGCKSSTTTSNKCPLDTFLTEVKKSLTEEKCDEEFCGSFPKTSSGNMAGFSFVVMFVCFLFSRL